MKEFMLTLSVLLLAATAQGASPPDFSGTWSLNAAKSQNLGMMSTMEYSTVITQTPKAVIVRDRTGMMGEIQTQETQYVLSGAATPNVSFTGDQAQTVTHWDGPRLVTTWTSPGAVAGTTNVRTETRSVSADGKTMTLETTNGGKPAIVFVFDRK
jgi:hypothetical protein